MPPRRPREFTAAPTKFRRTKAGADEGAEMGFPPAAKESTLQPLISQKSKIFASFPHRGKPSPNDPGQKAFSAAGDKKPFPRGEGGSPQARRMRNGETFRNGCTKTNCTHERKPPHLALPLGELSPQVTERAVAIQKSPLRPVCALDTSPRGGRQGGRPHSQKLSIQKRGGS